MNTALDTITLFLKQFEDLKALHEAKRIEQSNVDLELSNWYHIVEGCTITHVAQSHKLMKMGKEILERRRNIKFEEIALRSTLDRISNANIVNVRNSIRTHIDKDKKVRLEIKERAII